MRHTLWNVEPVESGGYDPSSQTFRTLPYWDPAKRLPDIDCPTILLLGKRRTGKSFLSRWLMYYMRDRFPFILVFTETRFNNFWQQHVPDEYVHDQYEPAILEELLDTQALKRRMHDAGDPAMGEANLQVLVVFDDVLGLSAHALKYDPVLQRLFTQGRHFNISVIMCLQDSKGIPPTLRGNTDLVFVLKQEQERNMETIHENWLSFMPKRAAMDLMEEFTTVKKRGKVVKRKQAIVIDSANDYPRPEARVYVTWATDPGPFVLGCKQYWENEPAWHPAMGKLDTEQQTFSKFSAATRRGHAAISGGVRQFAERFTH